jgi:hypothetical protein
VTVDRARGEEIEEALASLLYGVAIPRPPLLAALDPAEVDEAAASVRRMIRERMHRGTGGLADWYPRTLAAWRVQHAADSDLDVLITAFCSSSHAAAWRDLPVGPPGISLEEAFYRFFVEQGIGDAAVCEAELLGAVVRALAVTPRARFVWPEQVRRVARGCIAVTRGLVLHAAVAGRYLHGPITPLMAALFGGMPANEVAAQHRVEPSEVARVVDALREAGLL